MGVRPQQGTHHRHHLSPSRARPESLARHRIDTLVRRAGRDGSTVLDPFDERAMADARSWFADGIKAGADPVDLRAGIATMLWPWAKRFAQRSMRRLPPSRRCRRGPQPGQRRALAVLLALRCRQLGGLEHVAEHQAPRRSDGRPPLL